MAGKRKSKVIEEVDEVEDVMRDDDVYNTGSEDSDSDYEDKSQSKKKKKSTKQRTAKGGAKKDAANTAVAPRKRAPKQKRGPIVRSEVPTTSTKKLTSKQYQSPKVKKGQKDQEAAEEDVGSFFNIVKNESTALTLAIDEWMERYESDKKAAIAEILTFVVESSGCSYKLTTEDIENKDLNTLLEQIIQDHFVEQQQYPIVSHQKEFKRFSGNFLEFWEVLIVKIKDSFLFDAEFKDYVLTWLTEMASSKVRAFRHTACLAMYKVINSMIHIANTFRKQLSNLESQRETEKKKKKKTKEQQENEEQLASQCEELNEKIEGLQAMMKEIFDCVFLHRYRDKIAEIRALSILSLGGWIESYSTMFLTNDYLKYIAWCLNDLDDGVRLSSLSAIENLYEHEDWLPRLAHFTKRFLPRIVEMSRDNSTKVSVKAIELLITLHEHKFLTDANQIKEVASLVFDEYASVRHAAARFAYSYLVEKKSKKAAKSKSTGKSKKSMDLELKDILDYFKQFLEEMPNLPMYIVETFWDLTDAMQDWEATTSTLLEDEDLEEEDVITMVRLLNAMVKKAAGKLKTAATKPDYGKMPKPRKLKKEKEAELIDKMTSNLAASLPQLLAKYQADNDKIQELIEIPQYFSIESFVTHRLQHNFTELLKQLKELFFKSTQTSIFAASARTFKYLTAEEHNNTLKSEAQTTVAELVRNLMNKFQVAYKDSMSQRVSPNEAEKHKFSVFIHLQRMKALISQLDLYQSMEDADLYKNISQLLDDKVQAEDVEDKSVVLAVAIILNHLAWRLRSIVKEKVEDRDQNEVDELIKERDAFLQHLRNIFGPSDDSSYLKFEVFNALLDAAVLFAPATLGDKESPLHVRLNYDDEDSLLDYFDKRISEKIIIDEEEQENEDDEDEDGPQKKASQAEDIEAKQEAHRQRLALSIARAFNAGLIQPAKCSIVLAHYVMHGKLVSDIVKHMFNRIKAVDPKNEWEYELAAMKKLFEQYIEASGKDKQEEALDNFKALCSRLSATHFSSKHPENVGKVVRDSITFVFEDIANRHMFLEGILYYVPRLTQNDAASTLTAFNQRFEGLTDFDEDSTGYAQLVEFRSRLESVYKGEKQTPAKHKRKKGGAASESEAEESGAEGGASKQKKSRRRLDLSGATDEDEDAANKTTDDEGGATTGAETTEDEDVDLSAPAESKQKKIKTTKRASSRRGSNNNKKKRKQEAEEEEEEEEEQEESEEKEQEEDEEKEEEEEEEQSASANKKRRVAQEKEEQEEEQEQEQEEQEEQEATDAELSQEDLI